MKNKNQREMDGLGYVCYGLGLSMLFFLVKKFVTIAWWNPRKIENQFRNQGINGPPYRLLLGSFRELAKIYGQAQPGSSSTSYGSNIKHTIVQDLLPHLNLWREKYGKFFLIPIDSILSSSFFHLN